LILEGYHFVKNNYFEKNLDRTIVSSFKIKMIPKSFVLNAYTLLCQLWRRECQQSIFYCIISQSKIIFWKL